MPRGALGGGLPSYDLYATTDGHVAVAALEPHFARRLAEVLGATREELTERFAAMPSAHWAALGRRLDLPLVAVREGSPAASADPQVGEIDTTGTAPTSPAEP